MADDYAIFKKEHRLVRFTNFEGKVVFPHPLCQDEAVFLQSNELQHHYRIRHLDALFIPKIIEETASDLLERNKAVSKNNVGLGGGLLKFVYFKNQHMRSSYRLDGRHQSRGRHSATINT